MRLEKNRNLSKTIQDGFRYLIPPSKAIQWSLTPIQPGLSVFWTEASRRGFTLQDVVKLLSVGPASQASLGDRKGALEEGYDADFVIWDPSETFTVRSFSFHFSSLISFLYSSLEINGIFDIDLYGDLVQV